MKDYWWTNTAESVVHGVRSYPGRKLTEDEIRRLGHNIKNPSIATTKPKQVFEAPKNKGGDK